MYLLLNNTLLVNYIPLDFRTLCVYVACKKPIKPMKLFRRAFQGNYQKLAEIIHEDSGLWLALKDREVLTDKELSECKNEVCYY